MSSAIAEISGVVVASPKEIGGHLRSLRLSASLSQRELGELTGLSQPAIARLEAGGQTPTLATIQKFAVAFRTDLLVRLSCVPLTETRRDD